MSAINKTPAQNAPVLREEVIEAINKVDVGQLTVELNQTVKSLEGRVNEIETERKEIRELEDSIVFFRKFWATTPLYAFVLGIVVCIITAFVTSSPLSLLAIAGGLVVAVVIAVVYYKFNVKEMLDETARNKEALAINLTEVSGQVEVLLLNARHLQQFYSENSAKTRAVHQVSDRELQQLASVPKELEDIKATEKELVRRGLNPTK